MRSQGRGELDSLYFTYPHFAQPPRDKSFARETPVAIVGAGPVGLVAALTLAKFGVRSIVIERKGTFNDGSRAICIARSSFHIFDRLGVAAPFLEKSLGWTTGRSFYRGRQFLQFEMPHDAHEKFMPMYNLQQQYIEKFLFEATQASGLVDVRWRSEATSVRDCEEGVAISVRDPNGDYVLKAGWLIAADGARSAMRAMRGLRLKGDNLEGRYVIADVQMKHDYPTIRRALFDPKCSPGGTVLIHRQPDDIWRIDYQLKADEDAESATREENVRAKVASILTEIGHAAPWALEWWSVYTANTLALDDYRDGRIFFAGDSAHIVPIFGVRGLNNGLADAENIGWKLALVTRGEASERLLDSYTPERRGATLDVFANASKSARFMTPPTHGSKLMRDAALSLALSEPFAGAFANPRQMVPYTYAESPITEKDDPKFGGGPVPGGVAPNVRFRDGSSLCDHLGRGFAGISFGAPADPARFVGRLRELDPDFRLIVIGGACDGAYAISLADEAGACADLYAAKAGDCYLVRPDGHVVGRWRSGDPDAPAHALSRILGS
ncbi:MAG: FAD-dependent monooxygenase [Pseudomonadota bacterium]